MTLRHVRLILFAVIVAGAAVSTATAQESLRFLFEITVDGSVVARPEITLEQGGKGIMTLSRLMKK